MKALGVSIWIWTLGATVTVAAAVIAFPKIRDAIAEASKPIPLEIVKEDLWKHGYVYEVKGEIYNPRKEAVRNVRIEYEITFSNIREPGRRSSKHEKLGTLIDSIKYIPPGGKVEFLAVGDVPTISDKSGCVCDDLKAKIIESQ